MGDIQTPTTKWKKRSKQNMKMEELKDSSASASEESFTTIQSNIYLHKSIERTAPFNMTTAPLQTVFDNIPFQTDRTEPSVEGFTCDTSGIKSVKKQFQLVIDFLEKWFIKILEYGLITGPTLMINKITDGICGNGKDVTPKERDLVRTHTKEFFATFIACYITYNWYYVMFFPKKLLLRPIAKLNTDRLITKNKWAGFIFKYLIVPFSLMNSILVNKIPFILYPVDNKTKFLILFYFIPKIILKYGAEIVRAFIDSVRLKKTKHSGTFITIMVLFGLISVFRVRFNMRYLSELFRFYSQIVVFFIPILVMFIIRMIFSSSHVWVTGILVFGYLLAISFFAMNIFGKSFNTYSVIHQINRHIYYKKPRPPRKPCDLKYYDNEGGCTPKPFSVKIIDFINYICDVMFQYKYELTFIAFFLNSFYNYIFKLKSGTHIKQYLVVLTFFGICLCLTSIGYRHFVRKENYEAEYEAELKAEIEEAKKLFGEVPEHLGGPANDPENIKANKPEISMFDRLYKAAANEEVEDDDADESSDILNKEMIHSSLSYLFGKPTGSNQNESEFGKLMSGFLPKTKGNDLNTKNTVVNSDQTIVKSYVPVEQIVYTTDPAFSQQTPETKNVMSIQEPMMSNTTAPLSSPNATPPVQQGTVLSSTPVTQATPPVQQGTVLSSTPVTQSSPPVQQGTVFSSTPPVKPIPVQGKAIPKK